MFQLVSDGGCEFTEEEVQQYGVDIVPFYVSFDHENYFREGIDISREDYFKRLQADKELFPKTSQPSPQDYQDAYRPHLEAGKDIISLTISSKLSGTHNSATLAADLSAEEFPERTIIVIDSLSSAMGQNLILRELIKMRDADYSIEQAAAVGEKVKETTKLYFALDTVEYLRRGGRVGPTTALVGGILNLRPVLHLVNGEVEQLESVRGRKKVLQLMEEGLVAALSEDAQAIEICVGHILCKEDAESLNASLEEALDVTIASPVTEVGAAIGTHTGPGAIAVAYCKRYESLVN